jgi:ribosomal protein S3AE
MASDSGIFKDLRLKMKNLVHQGVQTLSNNEMHSHTLSDKIDAIIENNTKSIVGVITGG